MTTMTETPHRITGGVDTHRDVHVVAALDERGTELAAAPELVARHGVGTETAGALLVASEDNPERLRDERAFAHFCGVSPIDASSGTSPESGSTEVATGMPTRPCGAS